MTNEQIQQTRDGGALYLVDINTEASVAFIPDPDQGGVEALFAILEDRVSEELAANKAPCGEKFARARPF